MRLLIVSQYFWPESFKINDLAESLHQKGHQVTVLTGMPSYPNRQRFKGYKTFSPRNENYQGINIVRVPLCSRGSGKGWRLALNYLSFVLCACLIGPWRVRDKYDAIFVFQPSPVTTVIPAVLLGKLKKIPVIWWVQDLWPETLVATGAVSSQKILNGVRYLVKKLYQACSLILVQAQSMSESVQLHGILDEKIRYFPNWAESFYQPQPIDKSFREQLNMPQGFCVLFAGNIGVAQSFDTILDAAELLKDIPDFHWAIVGDGRQLEWLQQQIKKRDLDKQFHLLGPKPPKTMPQYFAAADVLLMTLRKDPIFAMTIPSKLQTYMACGRPVMAGIDGEGAKVVTDANAGYTAEAENAGQLAERLRAMYALQPESLSEMARQSRRYYEQHFERDMLITQLEGWLLELSGETK